ncbi:MAG: hypothetical protein JO303_10945 [Caulobacteraceae bacterium]|nr:hypothetical protein [Caulobacteraceae bacterium]
MSDPLARAALAAEHVTKGRIIVAKQRALIARLRSLGHDCDPAETLLRQFERSLSIFEQDLADLAERART